MPKIADLSKRELLSLIYNGFGGETVYRNHPCFCASCGKGDGERYVYTNHWGEKKDPEPYGFICDACEGVNEKDT